MSKPSQEDGVINIGMKETNAYKYQTSSSFGKSNYNKLLEVMATTPKPLPKDVSQATEDLLEQLPKESFWELFDVYKWEGFWFRPYLIESVMSIQSHFEARDDDVILASYLKTGTTWVKALLTCLMHSRKKGKTNDDDDKVEEVEEEEEDLLAKNHPAFYVQTLEVQIYGTKNESQLSGMKSPRTFHTHLPYSLLPDSIKKSDCKIVYITRNPKDTLVSLWHFFNTFRTHEQGPYPFERAFEDFCNGTCLFGPFFEHILQYWKETSSMPPCNKIMFLKYEDLKRDPKGEVKKLALFLGRPFDNEKQVDDVLERCSLKRLKSLEVNKNGVDPWIGMPNSAFFRLGIVGDWKNYFTPEMAYRLDENTRIKLEGTGLHLDENVISPTTKESIQSVTVDLTDDLA